MRTYKSLALARVALLFFLGCLLFSHGPGVCLGLRLPSAVGFLRKHGWLRPNRQHVLQSVVSTDLSSMDQRVVDTPPVASDGSATEQASITSPSLATGLEHPALATVFTKDAPKWLPKLALKDSYPDTDLDRDLVTVLGQLASIAYCSRPELLAAWNCTRCAGVPEFQPKVVIWDPVWDLVGFVGWHPKLKAIVASFRGTDSSNWGNWVENMRSWRTDKMYPIPGNPHALVHAGFEVLWSSSMMKASVTQGVGDLLQEHPGAKLYAVGHSMGAALAQLCALDLKFTFNISYVGTTTFGAPRVGNWAYQQLFNSYIDESWRFTHNRDIVPSVPLEIMGFHHVAREIWEVDMEGDGMSQSKWLLCDDTGEDPSCHNSACYLGICTSIADHLSYLGLNMYQDSAEC